MAAERLYLTQSTISAHIHLLEEALQTRLIERGARKKLQLTQDGKRVYTAAQEILNRCEALQALAFDDQNEQLSIAASTVPSQYVLPGVLSDFLRRYRQTQYYLRRGDSQEVHRLLENGEARLGFVGAKLDGKRYVYHPLLQDKLVLIAPPEERLKKAQEAGMYGADLLGEPMIFREENSGTQHEGVAYLQSKGVDVKHLHVALALMYSTSELLPFQVVPFT